MPRIALELSAKPIDFTCHDSVNAALVKLMTDNGLAGAQIVGRDALPWTFATKGFSRLGGLSSAHAILVSSPAPQIVETLARADCSAARVNPVNGDRIDLSAARIVRETRGPAPGVEELMVHFASPFVVMRPKSGREKTRFHETLEGVDLGAAFSAGLSRRAGRPVKIEVGLDALTRNVDGQRRLVRTRTDRSGRAIMIPAFSLPLTLRGTPEDVSFAYLAGLGAKTTGGFGCPILPA